MADALGVVPELDDLLKQQRAKLPRYGQCADCLHYNGWFACSAYTAIPGEILTGEHDHRKPFPGDNGIRFEPANDEADEVGARRGN